MNTVVDSDHTLHPGWKFALYLVVFFLLLLASGTAIRIAIPVITGGRPPDDQLTVLALNELALAIPAVGAMLLAVRLIDRRPRRG